jgi:hypothetical protein
MPRTHGTQPSHHRRRDDEQPQDEDDSSIIGEDLEHELGDDFEENLHKTMSHEKKERTHKDHRNKLKQMINFWKEKCPEYYAVGVRQNTPEEIAKPSNWFTFTTGRGTVFTEDLHYQGLNFKFVAKFLNTKKTLTKGRNKGMYRSYDDMRKYRDAIKNGATIRNELLSNRFCKALDRFLAAYQREYVGEKKQGNAESKDADPITFELYLLLLKWAAEDGNTFVFFWTQLQWNCMSRCANISPVGFANMKVVMDAHAVLHTQTKADQEGERCFAKHIFANEENWLLCPWTGMALFCALDQKKFAFVEHNKFFWEPGTEEGTAAKKYQEQLHGMITKSQERIDAVKQHCRLDHFNAYGLRKGPASHATAGTTMPPSMPSIAHRGDWSMGAVFDAYFKWLPTGDQYLGRILTGKDPNNASFKTLPPHWNVENPLADDRIIDALKANFLSILEHHGDQSYDPTGLLLRCLACMVWHSDAILEVVHQNPSHELHSVPLFQPGSNLAELKGLVTTNPTPGVMTTATGIPPHVEVASQLKEISDDLRSLIKEVQENEGNRKEAEAQFQAQVIDVVKKGIEEQHFDNGHVTGLRLKQILDEHVQQQRQDITTMFQKFADRHFAAGLQGQEQPATATNRTAQVTATTGSLLSNLFTYRGQFWHVPENFKFPNKPTLDKALRLWLKGSTVAGGKVVRPYRLLAPSLLPESSLQQQLRGQWQQFFKFINEVQMEDGTKWNSDWPTDTITISNQQLELTEKKMWAILRERVSYCFVNTKRKPESLSLSTWAKKITTSNILAYGTETDKAFVAGKESVKRKKTNRKRQQKQTPLYPQRQQKRNRSNRVLGGLTHAQAMIQRDRQFDRLEGRQAPPAAFVHQDLQTPSAHVQWLIDEFGNKQKGYKQCPIVDGQEAPRKGKCACPGCDITDMVLEGKGAHHCARCGIPVHNLCSQRCNTWLETRHETLHFCSEMCENAWRGEFLPL